MTVRTVFCGALAPRTPSSSAHFGFHGCSITGADAVWACQAPAQAFRPYDTHVHSPMMAGSHIALGAAAWLVASPHLGLGSAEPVGIAVAAVSSLLPDIDHPKSWVGRRLGPVAWAVSWVFGHRGVTHSVLAVAACAWVLLHGGAPRWAADAVAVGYASHLAADLLTPNGLRLAWPFKRTWALPLCKSGSQMEPLVVAALVWWAASGVTLPPPLQQAWQLLHGPAHHSAARVPHRAG